MSPWGPQTSIAPPPHTHPSSPPHRHHHTSPTHPHTPHHVPPPPSPPVPLRPSPRQVKGIEEMGQLEEEGACSTHGSDALEFKPDDVAKSTT